MTGQTSPSSADAENRPKKNKTDIAFYILLCTAIVLFVLCVIAEAMSSSPLPKPLLLIGLATSTFALGLGYGTNHKARKLDSNLRT